MTHQIVFTAGIFIGTPLGFLMAGILASNKIANAWHDGYRAGKYKNDSAF